MGGVELPCASVLDIGAFAVLAIALVLHGRAGA